MRIGSCLAIEEPSPFDFYQEYNFDSSTELESHPEVQGAEDTF